MPLFEYECRGCGHHFEYLTRDGRSPACPSCDSGDLQKLLSVFAVGATTGDGPGRAKVLRHDGQSARDAVGPCGACGDPRGPGSCSMN